MNFVDRQLLASFANFIVPDLGLTNTQFGLLTGLAFIIVLRRRWASFMGVLADTVQPATAHRDRPRALERADRGIGRGARLLDARRAAHVHRCRRVDADADVDVDARRSVPAMADSASPRASTTWACRSVSAEPADRRLPGTRDRLAQLLSTCSARSALVLAVVHAVRQGNAASTRSAVDGQRPPGSRIENRARSLRALRARPRSRYTIAGGVAMHFVLGAATFDQLWYVQERGFERAEIARMTGWIGMVAGMLGNLFGGLGSDWLQRRTGIGPRRCSCSGSCWCWRRSRSHIGSSIRTSMWFWIGVFFGFLPARRVLRSDVLDGAGTRAAADPRDGRRVLHPDAQPDRRSASASRPRGS